MRTIGLLTLVVAITVPVVMQPAWCQAESSDRRQIQMDDQRIQQDRQQVDQARQQAEQYMSTTGQQMQAAEAARPGVEKQLADLEKKYSPAQVRKMIMTPGNQLYVLYSWLYKEQLMKSQVQRYMDNLQTRVQQATAQLQQDQYSRDVDQSDLNSAVQNAQQQQADKADQQRMQKEAQVWSDRNAPPRMYGSLGDPNWIYGANLDGNYQPFDPFGPYQRPKNALKNIPYFPTAQGSAGTACPVVIFGNGEL